VISITGVMDAPMIVTAKVPVIISAATVSQYVMLVTMGENVSQHVRIVHGVRVTKLHVQTAVTCAGSHVIKMMDTAMVALLVIKVLIVRPHVMRESGDLIVIINVTVVTAQRYVVVRMVHVVHQDVRHGSQILDVIMRCHV